MSQSRRFFCLFLTICLLLVLATSVSACSVEKDTNKEQPLSLDMTALAARLQEDLNLTEELSPVEEEVFGYLYDIAPESYTEQVLLLSTGATADEICLVRAADKNSQKAMKEKMIARIDAQKESFATYLPQEAAKLENAVITEQGDYLFLVVCSQPEKADNIIKEALQEK